MIGEEKLDELKSPVCPLCGNPSTRMEEDSPSGWCPKCGAAWCNYISLTIKVGGEDAAEMLTRKWCPCCGGGHQVGQ